MDTLSGLYYIVLWTPRKVFMRASKRTTTLPGSSDVTFTRCAEMLSARAKRLAKSCLYLGHGSEGQT